MFPVYEEKKKTCIYIPALPDMNPLICTIQLNSSILQKDAWSLEWARNSFTWRKVILQSFFRK